MRRIDAFRAKRRSFRLLLAIAAALSAGACAMAPHTVNTRFTARGSDPPFVLRIDDEDRISISHNGIDLAFPPSPPAYPRWSGAVYSTHVADHSIELRIRNYLRCEVAGIEPRRTARVEVRLDGQEMEGCGHYN
jgi:hypothetical protein